MLKGKLKLKVWNYSPKIINHPKMNTAAAYFVIGQNETLANRANSADHLRHDESIQSSRYNMILDRVKLDLIQF